MATREDISKGKFSFVTEIYDMYEICFISKVPPRKYINRVYYIFALTSTCCLDQRGIAQEVSLVTKHGVEAKSYEGVSKLFLFSCMFLRLKL